MLSKNRKFNQNFTTYNLQHTSFVQRPYMMIYIHTFSRVSYVIDPVESYKERDSIVQSNMHINITELNLIVNDRTHIKKVG